MFYTTKVRKIIISGGDNYKTTAVKKINMKTWSINHEDILILAIEELGRKGQIQTFKEQQMIASEWCQSIFRSESLLSAEGLRNSAPE